MRSFLSGRFRFLFKNGEKKGATSRRLISDGSSVPHISKNTLFGVGNLATLPEKKSSAAVKRSLPYAPADVLPLIFTHFRSAVRFGGENTQLLSGLSPKGDCGTKTVEK